MSPKSGGSFTSLNNSKIIMKKVTIVCLMMIITDICLAQNSSAKKVPVVVKAAFEKQFPGADNVKWEKEGSNFEAGFDLNKKENSAVFDAQGNLLEAEVEMEVSQLPTVVQTYMKEHYQGMKVKEAAVITDAGGIVTYEAEIKGKDVLFDSKGNFIKEIKI